MFNRTSALTKIIKCCKNLQVRSTHLMSNTAYVDGEWVKSSTKYEFEVINPADNSVVECVPNMPEVDVVHAIDKAYEAFQVWKHTTNKERSILLRKWYNLMTENAEALARIMTLESGKPVVEARGEVAYGNSFVEWFSEEARRINGEIIPSPVKSKQIFLYKQPIGVAALITPWNFPHAMITRKAAAALAAGCTVVIKPAEDTPLTALALAKLAHDAGIPRGVFNVITCDRQTAPSIGKLFCTHPNVAGISFTGSTQVGKQLFEWCAPGIKRIGLELGGDAPFIVFPTANIDKAVQGALQAKFRNCGQTCVSANRFLLHASIHSEFVRKFKDAIAKFIIGPGMNDDVTIGPLINKQQFSKVDNIVNDAKDKGATIIYGGGRKIDAGELFYKPTIVTNVKPNMRLYTEEVFGPVATCIQFATEEEAIRIANATRRGLAGYFYSKDIKQIFRVARELEVGMVGVNEGLISTAEAAFGGIKESGIGREGSSHGIDDYVYIKYMCLGNLE